MGACPDPTTPQVAQRLRVRVRGLVQGVGFRPFVYGLAEQYGLAGWVKNDPEGVLLEVEGANTEIFLEALTREAPPLAHIDAVETLPLPPEADVGFAIVTTSSGRATRTGIGPDVAVCDLCLEELFDPTSRFYLYPFLNCTHCGPRYTIIEGLPYDRPLTSMKAFKLCAACEADYNDPQNRRFHAQPIACEACGPQLSTSVEAAWDCLGGGGILAIKGLGGFHLACDARNADSVERLRRSKCRDGKPFAVMVANLASAEALVELDETGKAVLCSPERPIVVASFRSASGIAGAVAPHMATLGVMLPATPLQYLLFHAAAGRPIGTDWLDVAWPHVWVMTSANSNGEAIIVDNDEARLKLGGIADHIVSHNRRIVQRNDDSVVQADARGGVPIRRSRGAVPMPIPLEMNQMPVLGLGALLKTTICVTRGNEAFVSQHLGDMDSPSNRSFLDATVDHLLSILAVDPALVAHDLHPDHVLTPAIQNLTCPRLAVQHHHAHIAAVAAEHGHCGCLVGLALDGSGFGPDGTIWGGELLALDGGSYRRLGRLRPLPQPGGDRAAKDPWRMAASVLHCLGRGHQIPARFGHDKQADGVAKLLAQDVNCPRTSSLGRVFDAAAALLGVCLYNRFEGDAAMRLEALVRHPVVEPSLVIGTRDGDLDLLPLLAQLDGLDPSAGADLFHGTVVRALAGWLGRAAQDCGVTTVALSGGCILNRWLRNGLIDELEAQRFKVLVPRRLPPGDGGLSLGQAWVGGRVLEGA